VVSVFFHGSRFIKHLPTRTVDFTEPAGKAVHDKMVEPVGKMLDAKRNLAPARTGADRSSYGRFCTSLDNLASNLRPNVLRTKTKQLKSYYDRANGRMLHIA
jgi:hypothetical protein